MYHWSMRCRRIDNGFRNVFAFLLLGFPNALYSVCFTIFDRRHFVTCRALVALQYFLRPFTLNCSILSHQNVHLGKTKNAWSPRAIY
ncbi:hypothetical protein KM043_004903 [Ampulex compressa]|nr:hypothetical protein KM043_004903 [Ampulex compressa]